MTLHAEQGLCVPRHSIISGKAQGCVVSEITSKEGIAMLKVVVLALGLAVVFLGQAKVSSDWTTACVDSGCIVGP